MMKKPIYHRNNERPPQQKLITQPSVTAPNQSMSVRTLMDRFRRGMPLDTKAKTPLYYNGEFPEIQGLDLTEIQSLKREADNRVKELQRELQIQEQQKKHEEDNRLKNEIETLKKQLEAKGNPARGKVEGEK